MNQHRHAKIYLKDDLIFLPTIQAFIEKTTLAFGLGQSEALALTLAGEEIFTYLCTNIKPAAEIEINCYEGGYYAALQFSLPVQSMAMRAFNLTSTININDETSLDEMGLLIASRMVDQLQISQSDNRHLKLWLRKDKSYPRIDQENQISGTPPTDNLAVVTPDTEELKFFIRACHHYVDAPLLPQEFHYPGKIVDMIKTGDYRAAIIRDPAGHIGGGILWYWSSGKVVECHGPFILARDKASSLSPETRRNMAESLLEHCLNAIARTPAVGLLNRTPGFDLPRHHFEVLGTTLEYHGPAPATEIPALFRQVQEDPGSIAWVHPEIAAFTRKEFQRLSLPREIRLSSNSGEAKDDFSVLTTKSDRPRQMITLYPLWDGNDLKKNVAEHLSLCRKEEFTNIFFVLDLGDSNNTAFVPALLENGFTPRLMLPYAGKGDLLILQETSMPEIGSDR